MISRVRYRQTGQEYALKTIQLEKISSKLAKEMRNEIEILKRLDHPNIIRESALACQAYFARMITFVRLPPPPPFVFLLVVRLAISIVPFGVL